MGRRQEIVLATLLCAAIYLNKASASRDRGLNLPGRAYELDWDDDHDDDDSTDTKPRGRGWMGSGREFSLFDNTRKTKPSQATAQTTTGASKAPINANDSENAYNPRGNGWTIHVDDVEEDEAEQYEEWEDHKNRYSNSINGYRGGSRGPSYSRTGRVDDDDDTDDDDDSYVLPRSFGRAAWQQKHQQNRHQNRQRRLPNAVYRAQDWWVRKVSPNFQGWPRIAIRVEPTTTLKIRKTIRPLKTIIRIGADFNTQLGVWQFRSSWEDAIIGGKLTLVGKELQLSKSWQLSVGAMEDLVTRLRFRAAIDLSTFKAYARVGFRTERLTPINMADGFTILKRLPLDGPEGHVKLEIKANLALPQPEIEYSTETHRSLVGMGDVEVSINELNLLLDY